MVSVVQSTSISRTMSWDLLAVEGNIDVSVAATSSVSTVTTVTTVTGAILHMCGSTDDITLATLSAAVTEP